MYINVKTKESIEVDTVLDELYNDAEDDMITYIYIYVKIVMERIY